MKVLIIGGTAFIGPHVVRHLLEAGSQIAVFHRGKSEPNLPSEVQHIHGERQQLPDFASQFREYRPDVVLHMIAGDAQSAWTARRVFSGLARRLVVASSVDVYRAYNRFRRTEPGPPDPIPLKESSPLRERLFPYRGEELPDAQDPQVRRRIDDYDKILVEQLVLGDPELAGTVLRLPAVYGPGDYQHRLFEHLKRMDDGRPAILLGQQAAGWRWARGYVEDVARAIALAVLDQRAAGQIYNVAEPQALSEAEWVRRIGAPAGWQGQVATLPDESLPAHLRQDYDWNQHLEVDSSRIREQLGYAEAVQLDEALRRAVAWERANPPPEIDPACFDYAAEDTALDASRNV